MRFAAILLCMAAMAAPAAAQVPGTLQGGGPGPDLATATERVERSLALSRDPTLRVVDDLTALRPVSLASPDAKARADALITQAAASRAAGKPEEARVALAEAASLLLDRPWTSDAAAAAAISLDVIELVADPARPLHYRLSGPPAPAGLTIRLALSTLAPGQRGATPNLPERQVAAYTSMPATRLGAATLKLGAVPDGAYALEARIYRGDTLVGLSRMPIRVVTGLAAGEREARARLAKVRAGDDAAATVTYPFDTVQAVNGWRRDIPENLDFAASIARSRAILTALESGNDPVWQATGDQYRAYHFALGRETMPYRLYVPKSWKPGAKFPLLVDLHGGGANEDSDFRDGRFSGLIQRLAEQYGFIVVAPLGYRPSGGYGVVYGKTVANRDGVSPDAAAGETVPTLSEADTVAVIERVAREYGTDPDRRYLVGNSMGGGGTWYIGGKYAATFAAISPNASSMPFDKYDFGQLAAVPVRIVVGELDAQLRRDLAHQAAAELAARGYAATLTVVANENHGNAWLVALPDTFAFFAAHRRAQKASALPAPSQSVVVGAEAALAGIRECAAGGQYVSIAVTGAEGELRVLLRGDRAPPHSPEAARRKAYTAASFGRPTAELATLVASHPDAAGLTQLSEVLFVGGGMPVFVDGRVVGGVGVSGSTGPGLDEACARVAIERLAGVTP